MDARDSSMPLSGASPNTSCVTLSAQSSSYPPVLTKCDMPQHVHTHIMKKLSIRNILVPIDFSKMSIQAIDTAKRLARRFGATVHLVHVHGLDYPAMFTAPMPPFQSFSVVDYQEQIEQNVARRLSDL